MLHTGSEENLLPYNHPVYLALGLEQSGHWHGESASFQWNLHESAPADSEEQFFQVPDTVYVSSA
jgi:hypothetical protein